MSALQAGATKKLGFLLITLSILLPELMVAQSSANLSRDDWEISAELKPIKMPGYSLYRLTITNESEDRSLLGLIELNLKGNDGQQSIIKCQYFVSVPKEETVTVDVPCELPDEKAKPVSIELAIEKEYPFLLDEEVR
jgi:hypothetical protein